MHTYLIYDRTNGAIVHRHRQSNEIDLAKEDERERLLKFVRPSRMNDNLDILSIGETKMKPDVRYRVNPDSHALEEMT